MKKRRPGLFLLLLLLVVGFGCVAYLAITPSPSSVRQEERSHGPAPYPPQLWTELGRIGGLDVRQGKPEEFPTPPAWQDGRGLPEIGSLEAVKGGKARLCNTGPFPAHFLAFGSDAPQFFHYSCFTCVDVPLVRRHPTTGDIIPGLAEAWAVEGRTVHFRLHSSARYSNGRPLRAADFALGLLLRFQAVQGSGEKESLRATVEKLIIHDDHTLSVTLRQENPLAPCVAADLLHPAEPGFYANFGSDYPTRYAQRIPPTTGAYTISRVEKGRLIVLSRVRDWWARELPYYRNSCNVDTIEHHFLTDEAQAWEFFLHGRLDIMQTRHTAAWQRYTREAAPVRDGRILCHDFRMQYPLPPYGLALNAEKIPSPELRRGILQSLDMDKALLLLFRGEGERLTTFTAGYKGLSPTDTPFYRFDPAAARACFQRAGYTQAGEDGILRRPKDGARLSVVFTYVPSEKVSALAGVLHQSAAACGADLRLNPVPWQTEAALVAEGKHEMIFWASPAPRPLPDYARFFSSSARGHEAPFRLNSRDMDEAIARYQAARGLPEKALCVARIDALLYQLAVWLPGWKENLVHLAHWSRIRFPEDTAEDDLYDVTEAHLYWEAPHEAQED